MVDYIAIILLILFSGFGFWLGAKIVSMKKKWLWIPSAVFCLSTILLYCLLQYHPAIEYKIIPTVISPFVEIINFFPFAMIFFGIAFKKINNKNSKSAVRIFGIFVGILGILRSDYIFIGTRINAEDFRVDRDGVCLQSTGYSCGAAAAVTFLNQLGIESTELEMAKLSRTKFGLGVRMVSLARAIEKKVTEKNLQVRLLDTDWETLKTLRKPCIVDVGWGFLVSHVMVLIRIEDSQVVIADPLSGIVRWSKERFKTKWHGSVIVIE